MKKVNFNSTKVAMENLIAFCKKNEGLLKIAAILFLAFSLIFSALLIKQQIRESADDLYHPYHPPVCNCNCGK